MSAGWAAAVNGVWSQRGELGDLSTVSCQRKPESPPAPTPLVPTGARSCRENRMTLARYLAGRGAARRQRGAECVTFVI